MTPPKEHDMEIDLRSRVVALEQGVLANGQRLTTLEAWQRQRDIDSARHDERWKRMDDKIEAVGAKIDEVAGTLKFIGKTIIGAIVLAVVAFMIAGGFHVP